MIIGIDLGTTNSLVGAVDSGFPILLAGPDGERLFPSVVHFPTVGFPIVGPAAQRMRALDPERTIYSVKRFIGRRFSELDEDETDIGYGLSPAPDGGISIVLPPPRCSPLAEPNSATHVSPEYVSTQILSSLRDRAEQALGTSVDRAVITVPAYFNDGQRQATKRAAEAAGLTVERILNEPTAAALAYGLDKRPGLQRFAVYDLGGGTFDVSILEQREGVFRVLSTHGNTRLGGDDIDARIVEYLVREIGQTGNDPRTSPTFMARLREQAVQAKHQLSSDTHHEIHLPFLHGGASCTISLERSQLESFALPIVERTRSHCQRALKDAGLTPADIDDVILVGGSTRMLCVRAIVADIFGREPNCSQHPDEAVALGATIQAGILSGALRELTLLDVTPLSLGIETFGGLMNVIIPRNTTIPSKAGEMFTNAVGGQRSMAVRILQGERELAKDNWELGHLEIPFAPLPKGQARVGIQFSIDADGILHVLARDTQSGKEEQLSTRSAIDVDDDAVEQMIAESVEHAFGDMSERVLTEARLKSLEMLPAVRRGLELVGNSLDATERERIFQRMAEVENAMAAADPKRLKKANAGLDEATQELATLLVERAMEAALKTKGLAG